MNRKHHIDEENMGRGPAPSQTCTGYVPGAQMAKLLRAAADVVERFAYVEGQFDMRVDRRPIEAVHLHGESLSRAVAIEEFVRVNGRFEGCHVRPTKPTKKVFVGGACQCGHHVIPGATTCWRCGREAPSKEVV